jgi:hypothetical protein
METVVKVVVLIFLISCLLAAVKTDVFAEKDPSCVSNCQSQFTGCEKDCDSTKSNCYSQCSNIYKMSEDILKCESACGTKHDSCAEGCMIDYSACLNKC